jgi:hypothetical protein
MIPLTPLLAPRALRGKRLWTAWPRIAFGAQSSPITVAELNFQPRIVIMHFHYRATRLARVFDLHRREPPSSKTIQPANRLTQSWMVGSRCLETAQGRNFTT